MELHYFRGFKVRRKSLPFDEVSFDYWGMGVLGWRKYVKIKQVLQGNEIKYSLNIPTESARKQIFTISPGFQPLFS